MKKIHCLTVAGCLIATPALSEPIYLECSINNQGYNRPGTVYMIDAQRREWSQWESSEGGWRKTACEEICSFTPAKFVQRWDSGSMTFQFTIDRTTGAAHSEVFFASGNRADNQGVCTVTTAPTPPTTRF